MASRVFGGSDSTLRLTAVVTFLNLLAYFNSIQPVLPIDRLTD